MLELVAQVAFSNTMIRSLAISQAGDQVATGFDDGRIALFRVPDMDHVGECCFDEGDYRHVHGLAFHPNGKTLFATCELDDQIAEWDLATFRALRRLYHGPEDDDDEEAYRDWDGFAPYSLSFNPSGMYLVAGSMKGQIKIWETT